MLLNEIEDQLEEMGQIDLPDGVREMSLTQLEAYRDQVARPPAPTCATKMTLLRIRSLLSLSCRTR